MDVDGLGTDCAGSYGKFKGGLGPCRGRRSRLVSTGDGCTDIEGLSTGSDLVLDGARDVPLLSDFDDVFAVGFWEGCTRGAITDVGIKGRDCAPCGPPDWSTKRIAG